VPRLCDERPSPDSLVAGAGALELAPACGRCNYGDGSRVARQNTRQLIQDLRALVMEQQEQIADMAIRLARYENGEPARPPAKPRIY
jgi:hypothetical protein